MLKSKSVENVNSSPGFYISLHFSICVSWLKTEYRMLSIHRPDVYQRAWVNALFLTPVLDFSFFDKLFSCWKMQETWVAQIDLESVVLFLVVMFTCLLETWEFLLLVCVDFFFFFWLHHAACRILVPDQGSNSCPLQWKLGVLTTGPPGKS